jgi:hypothetical protein
MREEPKSRIDHERSLKALLRLVASAKRQLCETQLKVRLKRQRNGRRCPLEGIQCFLGPPREQQQVTQEHIDLGTRIDLGIIGHDGAGVAKQGRAFR